VSRCTAVHYVTKEGNIEMQFIYRPVLRNITSFLIFLLVIPFSTYSQKPQWVNYTNIDYITTLSCYNNILWIGARGGVARFDPATMTKTIFTRADGLIANDVQALAVGPDGRVWVVGNWGNNGISVYDGAKWSTVTGGNSQSIEYVYEIHVAADGTVWFTMNSAGLWNYKNGAINNLISSNDYVQSFAVDPSNHVWAAGAGSPGVEYYNGSSWTQIDSSNSGIGSNTVSRVLTDKFGRVWFSTPQGISMYDGMTWHTYNTIVNGIPTSNLTLATIDSKRNLWLTYAPYGSSPKIIEFDGANWQTFDSTNTHLPAYSNITCSCADSLGSVYFALVPILMTQSDLAWRGGGQLLTFNGTSWKILDVHSGTLPFSPVYHFGLAGDGSVWMGTDQNGVVEDNGGSWKAFDSQGNGIFPSNDINGIALEQSGNVWVVGFSWNVSGSTMGKYFFEGGASHYDGTKWTTYNLAKGNFPSNDVECVAVDKNGVAWFGTNDKGVVKYDGSSWTTYNTSNSALPSNTINCCVVDEQDNVWFGTNNGVAKFDGVNWTARNSQNSGLPSDNILSMAVDKTGKVWFLAVPYLVSYDGSAWNSWGSPSPTRCLCIDSTGSAWVGTYGNGVSKFNGTSWTTFTSANSGIGYNYIEGIMADSHGNIYFGGQDYGGGVSVYNPNGVTKVSPVVQSPSDFRLYQNYPNPFNPTTTISFNVPSRSFVSLKVFDMLGREVSTIISGELQAGSYVRQWTAMHMSSGVYFYRLQAGTNSETKKLLLLK